MSTDQSWARTRRLSGKLPKSPDLSARSKGLHFASGLLSSGALGRPHIDNVPNETVTLEAIWGWRYFKGPVVGHFEARKGTSNPDMDRAAIFIAAPNSSRGAETLRTEARPFGLFTSRNRHGV